MGGIAFATVGDNCIDCFLPDGDALVGGNAVNVAVQLSLMGCTCDYFGAVGADAQGDAVLAALALQGVGTAGVNRVSGAATARTDIETLPDGDRRFVSESFGACSGYRPGKDDMQRLRRMDHVHIGWMRGGPALRQGLRGSGAVVSQDLSVNNWAEELDPCGLDIAFCSAAPQQADSVAGRLLERGAGLAVVTMGAAGALAHRGTEREQVSATFAESLLDATGAGDAFIAGFLDAWSKGLNLKACLLRGAERGALACSHRGGFPQRPLQPFVHDEGR